MKQLNPSATQFMKGGRAYNGMKLRMEEGSKFGLRG